MLIKINNTINQNKYNKHNIGTINQKHIKGINLMSNNTIIIIQLEDAMLFGLNESSVTLEISKSISTIIAH